MAIDFKQLVSIPQGKQSTSRRIWSIDLETVWLPFFTATNAVKETAIPADTLGAPLRLAYEKDGTPRFSANGKPVIRVAKELGQAVMYVRQNFTASLMQHAHEIATENPDAYKASFEANFKAGEPIVKHDNEKLTLAILARMENMQTNEPIVTPPAAKKAVKPAAKVKHTPAHVTTPAEPAHDNGNGATPEPAHEPELVTA